MIPNIIGKQFGRWTVLSKTTRKTKSNNFYYFVPMPMWNHKRGIKIYFN